MRPIHVVPAAAGSRHYVSKGASAIATDATAALQKAAGAPGCPARAA
ncbi:MAG: hypothetical protein ACKOZU_00175 [Planctomycetaceae bacterium]